MYKTHDEEFILHYDLDSFYASAELLDRPELEHKVVVVGNKTMVATSNYQARKFKIRSAMPIFIAEAICKYMSKIQKVYCQVNTISSKRSGFDYL